MKSVLLFPRLSHSNISVYDTGGCSRDVLVGVGCRVLQTRTQFDIKIVHFAALFKTKDLYLFDQDPDSFRF